MKTFNPITYQFEQQRKREEEAKLDALRPLRNACNKALKAAGINRAEEGRNGRIAGITTVVADGWTSELVTWSSPNHVRYAAEVRKGDALELLRRIATTLRAAGFRAEVSGRAVEVYPTEVQS